MKPLLALCALAAATGPAAAQSPLFTFYGDSADDQLGLAVAGPGDLSGDGVPDLLVAAPGDPQRTLRAFSGSDGAALWTLHGSSPTLGFARTLAAVGDVDGDGFGDFAVSDGAAAVLRLYSGQTRAVLRQWPLDARHMVRMRDVDGDGVSELLVSASHAIRVLSCATGAELQAVPTGAPSDFGYSVADVGDVDADGTPDFAYGAFWEDSSAGAESGRAYVHSGATGALLFALQPTAEYEWFGDQVLGVGDVNADGHDDVLVVAKIEGLFSWVPPYFRVFSGATGAVLYSRQLPSVIDAWNLSVANLPDLDGDGLADFAVARNGAPEGAVLGVYSAADGAELWSLAGEFWSAKALAPVGDLDGDGWVEALLGADFDDTVAWRAGAAFVHRMGPAAPPSTYCAGLPNSVGPGARIAWSGSPAVAHNQLQLSVTGLPLHAFGLFYYGPEPLRVPFGHGLRCVGAGSTGIFRLGPPIDSGAAGAVQRTLDFTAPPFASGPGAALAGTTWRFQYWYRDVPAGLPGFNLSDALAVPLIP